MRVQWTSNSNGNIHLSASNGERVDIATPYDAGVSEGRRLVEVVMGEKALTPRRRGSGDPGGGRHRSYSTGLFFTGDFECTPGKWGVLKVIAAYARGETLPDEIRREVERIKCATGAHLITESVRITPEESPNGHSYWRKICGRCGGRSDDYSGTIPGTGWTWNDNFTTSTYRIEHDKFGTGNVPGCECAACAEARAAQKGGGK